jgi:dienelactone hydrolase
VNVQFAIFPLAQLHKSLYTRSEGEFLMSFRKVANPMGDRTFNDMTRDFFQHYGEKDYAGALEILNREAADFPEQAGLITYNQACMLGAQNLVTESLAVLHQAADKGYWYDSATLHQDVDFATLLGNPEFEALAVRFQALFDAKQSQTFTTRTTIAPTNGAIAPYPLLLGLHGNQSNAAITSQYWEPAAKAGWLVGVLQSSQIGFTATTFVWNDEARSLKDVEQNHAELMQANQVDPARAVVGGFSAGSRMAVQLGLTQPFPIQGVIALGPYLAGKLDEWQALLPAVAERGTRFYLIVGDNDHPAYEDSIRFTEMLKAANVPHQIKVYPGMAHVYPPDFDSVLLEALAFIVAGERVGA